GGVESPAEQRGALPDPLYRRRRPRVRSSRGPVVDHSGGQCSGLCVAGPVRRGGAVGGHVYSLDAHGRHAAEVGLRILDGEAPETISVVEPADHRNMFDWRELRRWGLDERRLPAGSIVSFRTPSAWDLYKWYVAGGATLLVVQSTLIIRL